MNPSCIPPIVIMILIGIMIELFYKPEPLSPEKKRELERKQALRKRRARMPIKDEREQDDTATWVAIELLDNE